ncbi:MAG: GNAT family N-acetyltransferase [Candidatus Hydrogenedentes bacterium]|nr:GNAT family N-acetyltransferase [Candidatus Hydrogenedentota bacterium]
MVRIQRITSLPANIHEFIDEIASGLHTIYGEAAAADYRLKARRSFSVGLLHPGVEVYAAEVDNVAAGIAMGFRRHSVGEISLLHVLERHTGHQIEKRLVETLVRSLQRDEDVATILYESVSLCRLQIAEAFGALGFEQLDRELMQSSLRTSALRRQEASLSVTCEPASWDELAECIVDAYTGHPERRLHQEVNNQASAIDFVSRVAAGNYGAFHPDYLRVIWRQRVCTGAIVGCEVSPDTGFVLQVVVRRDAQRQGLGRILLQELAAAFRHARLNSVALGVTCDNPARRLYQCLGFQTSLPVQAYVWWRAGAQPG